MTRALPKTEENGKGSANPVSPLRTDPEKRAEHPSWRPQTGGAWAFLWPALVLLACFTLALPLESRTWVLPSDPWAWLFTGSFLLLAGAMDMDDRRIRRARARPLDEILRRHALQAHNREDCQ